MRGCFQMLIRSKLLLSSIIRRNAVHHNHILLGNNNNVWLRRGVMKREAVEYIESYLTRNQIGVVSDIATNQFEKDKPLAFFCAWHAARAGDTQAAFILSQLFSTEIKDVAGVGAERADPSDVYSDEHQFKQQEVITAIKEKSIAESRKKMLVEVSDIQRKVSADGKAIRLSPAEKPRMDSYEALRWLRKAVTGGHVVAMVTLGNQLLNSDNVTPSDVQEAIEMYKLAAEHGHTDAMYNLSMLYYEGNKKACLDANPIECVKWATLAHSHGDYDATYWLAKAHMTGYKEGNIDEDWKKATRLLHECIEGGSHQAACYDLGMLYLAGNSSAGIRPDREVGEKYIERAASLGSGDALYYIGNQFYTQNDYNNALEYFRRAGEAGCDKGWCSLGALLFNGVEGKVDKDYSNALLAYERAMELGSIDAYRNIASMYAYGQGVKPDLTYAKYLLDLAKTLEGQVATS